MRRSKFTESQIVEILKAVEGGLPVAEVIRKHGISRATFFTWKQMCKYTQSPAPDEQANPRSRRGLVGAGAVRSRALLGGAEQGAEFTEPVALAVDVNDRDVMQ